MAFFKFRTANEGSGAGRQTESIEAMRRRARHRLIGATVLVLAGVIGFPLLFDTQPRPISVDIPIEIPDRNKARPLPIPAPAAQAPVASGKVSAPPPPAVAPTPAAAAAASAARMPVAPKPEVTAKADAVAPARLEPKPEAKPEAKPEPKPAAKAGDGAKAQALLEGKASKEAAAADGRFVVQIGAFADNAKAREARLRVERAGLKTYTQVAETSNGRRIRVRVGPFATRAEADKAAHKIKGLDLPAAILTLS
jgi:DedD protein